MIKGQKGQTRRTGIGLYLPFSNDEQMPSQFCRINSEASEMDMPSTPAAPLFAFTRFHALRR